ncbi:MAG: 23S rRNA (adenine(2503)-C(2))-methyltransferase RlmN, partial [Erysipelotrichaceae bacterium]|nr:23S rRNA (adenine(2503)-C(2))-methyltransferase RlmN [Erysipelotrichaceae bacterium]
MMRSIYDISLKDLEAYLLDNGMKPFHAKQIFRWLYHKRVHSFDEMTDISKKMIEKIKEDFSIDTLKVVTIQTSKDGTKKFLFEMEDGALVESVLMIFDYGFSACLTSQVGCNMGCNFCASGLLKKQRDLSAGEIVCQALMVQRELDKQDNRLGNIVVMGTGEPFDNYDNVM